jgi:putative transposase
VPEKLRRSLRSTNLIESALSVAGNLTRRVKRWRGGDMRLRWTAAGLLQGETHFRRIAGHKSLPLRIAALEAHDARLAAKTEAA